MSPLPDNTAFSFIHDFVFVIWFSQLVLGVAFLFLCEFSNLWLMQDIVIITVSIKSAGFFLQVFANQLDPFEAFYLFLHDLVFNYNLFKHCGYKIHRIEPPFISSHFP